MQSLDNFSLGLVRTPLILNRLTTTIGLPLLSCAILHARKKQVFYHVLCFSYLGSTSHQFQLAPVESEGLDHIVAVAATAIAHLSSVRSEKGGPSLKNEPHPASKNILLPSPPQVQ